MLTLLETPAAIDSDKGTQGLMLGGVAILAAFVLVIAILIIRKKFFPEEEPSAAPAGFGVSELKDLHAQGLLTDEEFAVAKAKIVAQSHAAFMAPKNKAAQKPK